MGVLKFLRDVLKSDSWLRLDRIDNWHDASGFKIGLESCYMDDEGDVFFIFQTGGRDDGKVIYSGALVYSDESEDVLVPIRRIENKDGSLVRQWWEPIWLHNANVVSTARMYAGMNAELGAHPVPPLMVMLINQWLETEADEEEE